MTTPELRVFLAEWFCGCGDPENGCARLRDVLALHPLYENREAFERLVPDSGFQYLLLCTLHHYDLNEHGGGIGGSWLTDKGKGVLEALQRESADGFDALCQQACSHGFAVGTKEKCPSGECFW